MIAVLLAVAAPSLALDYQAPAACPAAAEVFAEVQRLRGGLIASDVDPDVRARVRVEERGARFSAEVETSTRAGSGRRTLEADTCRRAVEAVAVVLALALANPLAPEPPAPAVPEPPVPPPPPAGPPSFVPFVELLGAARFGVLPSPMASVLLGGGVERGWLRLRAQVGLAAPSLVQGSTGSAGVESWFQGALSGCGAVLDATARVELCGSVDAALLAATGRGVRTPAQGSALWVGLFGGAAVRSALWRGLGVVLDGGVGVALARPRFFVQEAAAQTTLYEAPLLVGRFGLGLQWRF